MPKALRFAFLLFLLLPYALRAADAPLNGQWQGPLAVPGGSLDLLITLVPLSNGSYYAALDVPKQKISRMPVEVELKGSEIALKIEQAGSSFTGQVLEGGRVLKGTWKQPGLTAPLTLERRAMPTASAAALTRLTPPYREENIKFNNATANVSLSGTLTVPAGPGPFPAVVLISDSGPQERDVAVQDYRMFGMLADYLTRRGVAVLRFDDRGVGQSGGRYFTTTTADLVTDAQAAMQYLRAHKLINHRDIGLIGHGEGANVSLLAAAQPQPPAFVVALAGYGQLGHEVLLHQQLEIMRLIGADQTQVKAAIELYERMVTIIRQTPNDNQARGKVAGTLRLNNSQIDPTMARARAIQLTSPWSRFFLDFDPLRSLLDVRCPVLALNGTDDLQVGAATNLPLLQKGLKNNRDVTVKKLAGVNHLFQPDPQDWPLVNGQQQPNFSPKALDTIREWIAKRTTAAPSAAAPQKPAASKTKNNTASK
ncbi:alpha/beta hydrolase family protein [Hymenobacter defluvii]|uniref:Alpha/beta hydrolase n=1 Tax=Hymenobacter defluvii TaxID=2054411 RepID=A0ABS3T9L3_9BACT|nr:alpha/beta hydrolase [Hymenobacter defluvii]MBO3270333.1 alpha/beta hydrolase [Hymenobacter defluvii]